MKKPKVHAPTRVQLLMTHDQLEATKFAHMLIGEKIEADITPMWAVSIPKEQVQLADSAIFNNLWKKATT